MFGLGICIFLSEIMLYKNQRHIVTFMARMTHGRCSSLSAEARRAMRASFNGVVGGGGVVVGAYHLAHEAPKGRGELHPLV